VPSVLWMNEEAECDSSEEGTEKRCRSQRALSVRYEREIVSRGGTKAL